MGLFGLQMQIIFVRGLTADSRSPISSCHLFSSLRGTSLTRTLKDSARPEMRERIFGRNRALAAKNLGIFSEWVREQGGIVDFNPPQAGSFAFVRYNRAIKSRELVDRMMKEESVFVVPGDCFGLENHLRISFGTRAGYLREGLERISKVLKRL